MPKLFNFLAAIIVFSTTVLFGKNIVSVRTNIAPSIDGVIGANEWMVSDSTFGFIQMEPFKGQPATERTTVYINFDDTHLYVAYKCYMKNLDQIVSNVRTRDFLSKNDDVVMLLLDTFNDKRSAFAFLVNPLGTQFDFRIADDGRNIDNNWDAEWQAAVSRTTWGWSAELSIPFSSIRYKNNLKEWGINLGRIIRSNSETVYWSGIMNDDFRVSQGGLLLGLEPPTREKSFQFTPYFTSRRNSSTDINLEDGWDQEVGADFSYKFTPGLTGNFTVNPDFATVEGDQDQINLSRWELQFPEKRLFFLEGGELFKTRIRSFYSRRIGDIDYGANAVGKIGNYNLGLVGVRTVEDIDGNRPASTFSVLRIKRDVLKSSTVGITAVDKSWQNDYTRSLSADYVLNLSDSWKLTGQFVSSTPGDFLKHSAWFVRFSNESNNHHYHFRYSDTGENFRDNVNETGFIRDDDMREVDSDLIYKFWSRTPPLKYLFLSSRNNVFWDHAETLRSWYFTESMRAFLNKKLSLDLAYNNEYKLYEKKFYNYKYSVDLGYNTDEWSSTGVGYTWGHNYDRDFSLADAFFRVRPIEAVALKYSFKYLSYNPDLSSSSTKLHIITLDYNFTRDLWIRVLTQNNSRDNRFYFYGLFAWRFKPPFGALYMIYTVDERDLYMVPQQQSKVLFLKLSYQFQL
jgi:hypothetical protein